MSYNIWTGEVDKWASQPDISAPRIPPLRLGARFNADFNLNWSGMLEYYRVFAQKKSRNTNKLPLAIIK